MILVTVGTQKQDFTRLLKMVDEINIYDEVIIQTGHNKYPSNKYENFDFSADLNKYISEADVIISHGGVGTVIAALEANKKVIIVPRLKKHSEAVDDHQLEITNKLVKYNYCLTANTKEELQEKIEEIYNVELTEYNSNTKKFNESLIKKLNEIL